MLGNSLWTTSLLGRGGRAFRWRNGVARARLTRRAGFEALADELHLELDAPNGPSHLRGYIGVGEALELPDDDRAELFVESLKQWYAEPPAVERMTVVGSYQLF